MLFALFLLPCFLSPARADTGSSLGDRTGEGSTPFTGLAQAPEANLFTGALTTRIPIEVPPGRKNLTPNLALVYSSAGGPSPFGYGWDLPIGRIERSTKWGVPGCTGDHTDDFVLVLPTGAAELVNDPPGSDYYRPKVEESYLRAQKFPAENRWEVYDRSGMKYTFGKYASARAGTNTSQFMWQDLEGFCHFTNTWALEYVEDPNGNVMEIIWSSIANVLYPAFVHYGGNTVTGLAALYRVRFLYQDRPDLDVIWNYRTGAPAQLGLRLTSIVVSSLIPGATGTIRTYTPQYDDEADGYQSLLSAITVTGSPTQHLAYAPSAVGHQAGPGPVTPPGGWDFLRMWTRSLDVTQTIMDMNGDGLLDAVRSNDVPAGWTVHLGRLDGGVFSFESTPRVWTLAADMLPEDDLYVRRVRVDNAPCNDGHRKCTEADTFDLTGDGIPDHVNGRYTPWIVRRGRAGAGADAHGLRPPGGWQSGLRQAVAHVLRIPEAGWELRQVCRKMVPSAKGR